MTVRCCTIAKFGLVGLIAKGKVKIIVFPANRLLRNFFIRANQLKYAVMYCVCLSTNTGFYPETDKKTANCVQAKKLG